jgi:hypothetical protein
MAMAGSFSPLNYTEMKTIKQVEIIPVYVGFMPQTMEERHVYISKEYEVSIHRCLCGCGEKTVLPLDAVHGWVLIEHTNGKISFTPSIGNFQLPCKSHYIITKNKANFV